MNPEETISILTVRRGSGRRESRESRERERAAIP
jgi:hypothetical protein